MRRSLPALVSGVLFGAGLALSDMINPARVLGFLDLAGLWDPTLAFVMGAAVAVSASGYALSKRMQRPLFESRFFVPASRVIDTRLVTGAMLFGIGWGLAGLCPGPAIAGLVLGYWQSWIFVAAMLVGIIAQRFVAAGSPAPRPVS